MPVAVEALLAIEDHQNHLVIKRPGAQAVAVSVVDQPHPQETVQVVFPIPEEEGEPGDMILLGLEQMVQAAQV
jgi:hypothetical protein